jgi:hypothetical protein
MPLDAEFQKKLQIFLAIAIVAVGARTAYIVYERHEAMKADVAPRQEIAMNADNYVMPKKLHFYDLKSAQELTAQPVWVKYGYALTYFPYDTRRHLTDFAHDAGTLAPLQKLAIQGVVTAVAPDAPGLRQVLARFALDGKDYAVSIGSEKDGDFKLRAADIFFIEDPHDLYKHWPADVWKKIDAHEVQEGMNELQTLFAIGMGIPEGSGNYGSETLRYANGGKPLVVTFENNKAIAIKAGT